jgi:hypothetical protein
MTLYKSIGMTLRETYTLAFVGSKISIWSAVPENTSPHTRNKTGAIRGEVRH